MNNLPDKRAEGAAGLNDRPCYAERSPGTAGNGRRDRFQDRHAGLNAAAVDQHGLHRLRDAMALNLLGPIFGHEADDDSANHRRDNDPRAEMIEARADKFGGPAMIEGQVSEQSDELIQNISHHAGKQAYSRRQE